MSNFKIIKKGYSQLEVDSYIERLKEDYEARLAEQKDRIFYLKDQLDKITNSSDNELVTSLVGAVERARLIENSSKNIYELETKKLSLLYTKMENLLQDENIQNDRSVKQELLLLIKDCRRSLESNITAQSENIKESTSGDPVKNLLSKMIGFNQITADYNYTKRQQKIIEENNKKAIKIIPTNEVIRKEVPSSVKVVSVRRQENKEKQVQNVLSTSETTNEFNKFLSQNSSINGANFENIMFSKSSSSQNSLLSSRQNRITEKQNETKVNKSNINNVKSSTSTASKEKASSKKTAESKEKTEKTSVTSKKAISLNAEDSSSKIAKQTKTQTGKIDTTSNNRSNSAKSAYESLSNLTSNTENSKTSYLVKAYGDSGKSTKDKEEDAVEISTKSKNTAKNDNANKSELNVNVTRKVETKTEGNLKSEKEETSITASNGISDLFSHSSFKSSSYKPVSSSSSSNPNEELSDEEFLRAYLGDLEFEEAQKEESKKNETTSYKSSSYSSTIVQTSSSKKSSSYVTGAKAGDYSPNETGFDLKEAINPKEDLNEIMKAFDFYNDNKKKK